MNVIRRWLLTVIGARGSAAILVGSHISTQGEQCVALIARDGWKQTEVRLSVEGAKRLASQMNEWATAAAAHNDERDSAKTIMRWQYIVDANLTGGGVIEPAEYPMPQS